MEYIVVGGYYSPGKTPQVINAVKDKIALGYSPYGTPVLIESSGWLAQAMVKDAGANITDYTLIKGFTDKTPFLPSAPPVGDDWHMLGSLVRRADNFNIQAWAKGQQVNPGIIIDLETEVTGVLPIANGGTGADNAEDAFANLTPSTTDQSGYDSVFVTLENPFRGSSGIGDEFMILGLNRTGAPGVNGWGCHGIFRGDRGSVGTAFQTLDAHVLAGSRFQQSSAKAQHRTPLSNVDFQEIGTLTYDGVSVWVGKFAASGGAFALTTFEGTTWGDSGGLLFKIIRQSDPLVTGYVKQPNGVDTYAVHRDTAYHFGNDNATQGLRVVPGNSLAGIFVTDGTEQGLVIYDNTAATLAHRNKLQFRCLQTYDSAAGADGVTVGFAPVSHMAQISYGPVSRANTTHRDVNNLAPGQTAFAYPDALNPFPESGIVTAYGAQPSPKSADSKNAYMYITNVNYSSSSLRYKARNGDTIVWNPIQTVWRISSTAYTGATAVDANGFVKTASPVISLFGDGTSEINDEATGATTSRLSVGVYLISGVLGFNSDATWWIEVPKDVNGQPLLWVDYSVDPSGDIHLRTFHRVHPESPAYARNIIDGVQNGDPLDITSGKSITLRVNMPE